MATLVCFHAHPDDEATSTGGLMAKAAAAGHRVLLVTATNGEHGEPQAGVLNDGEDLWTRRIAELANSAKILGAETPRLLGYRDSGMIGESFNEDPACFWQADVEVAAARLAEILREVDADVLTIYDDHGGYGHPDHIQIHRVGLRAAEIAGVTNVFEATMNRDRIKRMMEQTPRTEDAPDPEQFAEIGTSEADISFEIDARSVIAQKRQALMAHRSQIGPDTFFLQMPEEAFTESFGYETFNVPGVAGTGGPKRVEFLPGLDA